MFACSVYFCSSLDNIYKLELCLLRELSPQNRIESNQLRYSRHIFVLIRKLSHPHIHTHKQIYTILYTYTHTMIMFSLLGVKRNAKEKKKSIKK